MNWKLRRSVKGLGLALKGKKPTSIRFQRGAVIRSKRGAASSKTRSNAFAPAPQMGGRKTLARTNVGALVVFAREPTLGRTLRGGLGCEPWPPSANSPSERRQ